MTDSDGETDSTTATVTVNAGKDATIFHVDHLAVFVLLYSRQDNHWEQVGFYIHFSATLYSFHATNYSSVVFHPDQICQVYTLSQLSPSSFQKDP